MKNKILNFIQILKGWIFSFGYRPFVKGAGRLYVDGKVYVKFEKNSYILNNNILRIGYNSKGKNGKNSLIRLGQNAHFECHGDARIFFDSDIQLFESASFILGDSYINSGCKIRVNQKILIGDGCAIGTDFTALDSNFHSLNGLVYTSPIIIEDNVWIGTRVTVLPGVTIGKGAVIGAGSVVTKNIDPFCLAVGNPAKIIKRDIKWSL